MNFVYYNGRQYELRPHKELGLQEIQLIDTMNGKVFVSIEFDTIKEFVADIVREKKMDELKQMTADQILGLNVS